MKSVIYIINRVIFALAVLGIALSATLAASAAEAKELRVKFDGVSEQVAKRLADGNYNTYNSLGENVSITLSCEDEISSLYVVFDRVYGEFSLTDTNTGKSVRCGKDSFLHTYLDVAALLGEDVKKVRLDFDTGAVSLADIYAFGDGELPSWVQIWKAPCDGDADLLLISSHSDDEQLFFAGILPYYAGERGLNVQVVYFTNHYDVHNRPHEQLNGLWTVGVKHYPVISEFPDLYSESLSYAYQQYKWAGYGEDDFIRFQVEMIRRFRPHVVVDHDIKGEYGHGTHILNTTTLMSALEISGDAEKYPELAEKYGVWDVPKTYIHLWEENKIVMDWNKPLSSFDGKTAYEVSVEGYGCHLSQHWTWFTRWLKGTDAAPITAASQITEYSPCEYGLYRSTVGADTAKNDFFENISLKKTVNEAQASKKMPNLQEAPTDAASNNEVFFGESVNFNIVSQIATASLLVFSVLIALISLAFVIIGYTKQTKNNGN